MHIGMMTAWNTDSGVAVHAEPLGMAWHKMGHDPSYRNILLIPRDISR